MIIFDSYSSSLTEAPFKIVCSRCKRKLNMGEPYWTVRDKYTKQTLYLCKNCAERIAELNAPEGV